MVEQLKQYKTHCDFVIERLFPAPAYVFCKYCFFISEQGLPEDVKVSTIEREMKPVQLPANFYRRVVRTNLIERGCPPEAVDCWMGHWRQGQEPWGKFSSYSLGQYITELRAFLLPLLAELGWRPVISSLPQEE